MCVYLILFLTFSWADQDQRKHGSRRRSLYRSTAQCHESFKVGFHTLSKYLFVQIIDDNLGETRSLYPSIHTSFSDLSLIILDYGLSIVVRCLPLYINITHFWRLWWLVDIAWHMAAGLLMQINSLPSKSAAFTIPQEITQQCQVEK